MLPMGSGTTMNTMGIVDVAFLAATAEDTLAASRTSGFHATNATAVLANLAGSWFGKRCSRAIVRPFS